MRHIPGQSHIRMLLLLGYFVAPLSIARAQTEPPSAAVLPDSVVPHSGTGVTCTACTKPGPGTQPVKLHCPWAYGDKWWAGSSDCAHGFCPGIGDHCETSQFRGTYPDGWAWDFNWTGGNDCNRNILAAAGGTVVLYGYDDDWGKFVVIDHGEPGGLHTITRYHHLNQIGDNIDNGTEPAQGDVYTSTKHIRAGDYVGANGTTGNSSGCHLHFVVNVENSNGTWKSVDPDKFDDDDLSCGAQMESGNFVDETDPAVNFTGPTTGRWYMVDRRLDWTVTDTQSNIRGFGQAWDAVPPNNSFPYATSGFLMLSWAGQGQHTAHVNAQDISWNEVDRMYGWLGYDTSVPTVVQSGGAAPGTYTTDQSIQFNATDAFSGVRGYSVGWDNPSVSGPTVLASSGSTSLGAMPGGSGTHTLYVRAWDNARDGNGTLVGNVVTANLGTYTYSPGPCGPPLPTCGTPQVESAMASEVFAGDSDAEVSAPQDIGTPNWLHVGLPAGDLLRAGRLYRIGFEYKCAAGGQLQLALAGFEPNVRKAHLLSTVDLVVSPDRWRPFWSGPFTVEDEHLTEYPSLRFLLDDASALGLEIRNVRVWSPRAVAESVPTESR